jgi:DNA-binding MarR family transcriptional regulator
MTRSHKPAFQLDAHERLAAGAAADAVENFRLILFCSLRLRQLLDRRLRSAGLTSRQGLLLTIVRSNGRPTLGEVAAAMSTTHQNAKQIASSLARKGMIRIVTDPKDLRTRRLVATATGRRGWQGRNAGDFDAIGTWFSTLSRREQKALRSLLGRLARSIGEK